MKKRQHITGNRRGGMIQTYLGNFFYPMDPRPDEVKLHDIAHALSNICRFGGHTNEFYSVAQHSVIVSQKMQPIYKHGMYGLLHDGSEAYIGDVVTPIKRMDLMDSYCRVEHMLQGIVYEGFHLQPIVPRVIFEELEYVDQRVLHTEKRDLLKPKDWGYEIQPYEETIVPLLPKDAYVLFMDRFMELKKMPLPTFISPEY